MSYANEAQQIEREQSSNQAVFTMSMEKQFVHHCSSRERFESGLHKSNANTRKHSNL